MTTFRLLFDQPTIYREIVFNYVPALTEETPDLKPEDEMTLCLAEERRLLCEPLETWAAENDAPLGVEIAGKNTCWFAVDVTLHSEADAALFERCWSDHIARDPHAHLTDAEGLGALGFG